MKILLLGPNGQVGWELQRALAPLGEIVVGDRQSNSAIAGDLSQPEALRKSIRAVDPQIIVNAAAYTAVDAAETDREQARLINATAPGILAEESRALGALLVHYSTDYVFDGSGSEPWREEDAKGAVNFYGKTKLEGETLIQQSGCKHLIFRTSWVYASRGRNFLRTMLRLAGERDHLKVVDDQIGAPTGAELIADVTAQVLMKVLAEPAATGVFHLTAAGTTSWHGFARHAIETARQLGHPIRVPAESIAPCRTADFPSAARRPHNSRLLTVKLREAFNLTLPAWQLGVERTTKELCDK